MPVENTITRSYGESKNIETVAFSLLALLRENNPDEFLISQGIEYLVGKKESITDLAPHNLHQWL